MTHAFATALVLVGMSAASSACFPVMETKVTRLEGTLTVDGQPIPDIEVTYTWDYRKSTGRMTVRDTTDHQGRFYFAGKRGLGLFIPLPVHSLTSVQLSFSGPDSTRTVAGQSYQAGPHVNQLQLSCDLRRAGSELCQIVGEDGVHPDDRLFWVKE